MLSGSSSRRLQEKPSQNFAEFELYISKKNLEIHMLQATRAETLTKIPPPQKKEVWCKISEVFVGDCSPNCHWSKNHYTHTICFVGELILQLHTHQLHSFDCGGINLCSVCVCISDVCLSCLYDIAERQLHNNNARGINIQLHAHQLHINYCWGIHV